LVRHYLKRRPLNMGKHLKEEQIDMYWRKSIPPEILISIHKHIETCDDCRLRLRKPYQEKHIFEAFQASLKDLVQEDEHLSYEEISNYIDNRVDEIDKEIIESHIEICSECKAELYDLRNFSKELPGIKSLNGRESIRPHISLWSRFTSWWQQSSQWNLAYAALMLVIAGALISVLLRLQKKDHNTIPTQVATHATHTKQEQQESSQVASNQESQSQQAKTVDSEPNRENPSAKSKQQVEESLPYVKRETAPELEIALNDNGKQVGLDREGNLIGLETLEAPLRDSVLLALKSEQLQIPDRLDLLNSKNGIQLGPSEDQKRFTLKSPIGTAIKEVRPTLRWIPLEGATGYIVSIFNSKLQQIVRTNPLNSTELVLPEPLTYGEVYRWQVTAIRGNEEITSPLPTAPEAKFKLLGKDKIERLTSLKRRYPKSHLALAIAYTQEGLLDDAETELRALLKRNPKSEVAKKLLNSLLQSRNRKPIAIIRCPDFNNYEDIS
jgi:anti-sigma factor RsiW